MTNLTREEIAEILATSRDEWQREYFKKYPVSEGTLGPLDMAAFHLTQADALLARLRPAWERMEQRIKGLEAQVSDGPYSQGRDKHGNPVNYCD